MILNNRQRYSYRHFSFSNKRKNDFKMRKINLLLLHSYWNNYKDISTDETSDGFAFKQTRLLTSSTEYKYYCFCFKKVFQSSYLSPFSTRGNLFIAPNLPLWRRYSINVSLGKISTKISLSADVRSTA